MKATYSSLMQSKFFNPAFNSAIFDGPVRIYFAQFHESLALKVYFLLQQKYAVELQRAKDLHRRTGKNILVMLYPTEEAFQMSFENEPGFLAVDDLYEDTIIGIRGAFEDEKLPSVMHKVCDVIAAWDRMPHPSYSPEVTL